jgi:hypothetical protein
MEGLSSSHEQLQRQVQNAQRQNDADQRDLRLNLNARVDAAEKSAAAEAARCDALRAEPDMRARAREDLENSLVPSAVEHNRVLQQLAKARSVVDDVRTEAADGVKRAAEVRNIERKEQLRFLEEGARLVAELRRYESLLVGGVGVAAPTPSVPAKTSPSANPSGGLATNKKSPAMWAAARASSCGAARSTRARPDGPSAIGPDSFRFLTPKKRKPVAKEVSMSMALFVPSANSRQYYKATRMESAAPQASCP